ncbi:UDP-2,3-diacylglucosamine hydrolase [Saccharobesus litoralis]|uniref:UDP-2,3-diacylglucosamine hydrolase n=1 Tax=Saccharobesus litoralis TaxID=2172099 RepID=A0A2S0VRJ7_9ALTE|nr:UDP-2,3-diacylglucosamine diphosphatase [Saccharobesus litoralis]AWB66847.1 UDP-2,3-diacylglucosamine hydrolase [Saccharobesus litoralis]
MARVTKRFNAVWLSDIHLGCKDCKAEFLLDFLDKVEADVIYLAGDIVDFWALEKRFHWPDSHNQLAYKLIDIARSGTKVIYVPGNHDEKVRKYVGMTFSDVEIHREYIHETAEGKRLVISHGDDFDGEVCLGKFHEFVGDVMYDFLLYLNRWCYRIRSKFGFGYWSLAGYIKSHVKGANEAIERFKHAAVKYAKDKGVDGIVCGHIHQPDLEEIDGTLYCNDGDWLENCTVLVENHDGSLELLYWTEQVRSLSQYANKPVLIPSQRAA